MAQVQRALSAGMRLVVGLVGTLIFSVATGSTQTGGTPGVWGDFRNGGTNVATGKPLPQNWSPTENIGWQTEIPGYGQSCPVVYKDRIFVTSVKGPMRDKCLVTAFSTKTGKALWTQAVDSSLPTEMSYYVSRAAPTPAVDSAALYAFFESGDLLAYDHKGKLLWQRSLVKEYGKFQNEFGIGPSLTQTTDSLFVLVDDPGPSYLLCIDKKTGKNRWKVDRESRKSWTSPLVVRQGDRDVVVVSSNGTVEGFDAKTGEKFWSVDRVTGNLIASVSVGPNTLYVGATNGQQRLSKPGGRTVVESNCCLRLSLKDGKPFAEVAWEGQKATCDFASPLYYRGHVYYVSGPGVFYCVDAATGKEIYSERIESGQCWATPIASGDFIYVFGKNGITTILKAGPKFEKVAVNRLWREDAKPKVTEPFTLSTRNPANQGRAATDPDALEPILYGAVAVDGAIYVRLGSHLYRIGKP